MDFALCNFLKNLRLLYQEVIYESREELCNLSAAPFLLREYSAHSKCNKNVRGRCSLLHANFATLRCSVDEVVAKRFALISDHNELLLIAVMQVRGVDRLPVEVNLTPTGDDEC
jgi:hypothetical protein